MTTVRWGAILASGLIAATAQAAPITAVLSLKGKTTMAQLAQNVSDPHSDHYGRAYENAEIRQLAAPSDQEYNDLIQGLKEERLEIVSESPTHLWIGVRGETKTLASLFGTEVKENGTHRMQMRQVRLPFHLNLISHVSGLDNTRHARPRMVRLGGKKPTIGGGVQQSDIKSAYGFAPLYQAGISGQGQFIAVATYDGFKEANVRKFYQLSQLNPMPTVTTVNFNGNAKYDEGSAGETELDAELSAMIAPGVSVLVFPSATNDDAGELQMFTSILDDGRAKVVNYSWGNCEDDLTPDHKDAMVAVYERAVAQGVNIFVASGDSGSDSCGNGRTQADWPAANGSIVAVGGTSFSDDGGKLSEDGWDGSGGGISTMFDLPDYQKGLGGIFVKRSYPDVAFNANPYTGQAIYTGSPASWQVVGGTSMASPQWAGFMALVNAARASDNKGALGFLNPLLYSMSQREQKACMHDITDGNNGAYSAQVGWDAVTGFGSMQADQLLAYLRKQ